LRSDAEICNAIWIYEKYKASKKKQRKVLAAVAYAENFRGGSKFRHNRVTSQIKFKGSAEGAIILGVPGHASGKILQNYT